MVHTIEPANIQAILATQFQDFELGELRRRQTMRLLGNGIFTADGKAWSWARALMRPQFARVQVEDMGVLEPHVQALFDAIPEDDGELIELSELLYRLTLDTATEFLFGESINSQRTAMGEDGTKILSLGEKNSTFSPADDNKGKKQMGFSEAFNGALESIQYRMRLGPLVWFVPPIIYQKQCNVVHTFTDEYVNLAYHRLNNKESTGRFVLGDALAAEIQDPIELRTQLLNILLAGRDTTASLLTFTFLLLARHTRVWNRLRLEIIAKFGTSTEDITFTRLKNLRYLQWVLNEALRLYPSVPVNFRMAVRDTTLPVGGGPDGKSPFPVMEGQIIIYSVYALHRREEFWGKDALEFRPERWEGRKTGWEYLPFNGGPRICLGQQYALGEASYVVTRLLQRFERVECLPNEKIEKVMNVTLYAPKGARLKFFKAAN
ncbi:cytochrome P450 [Ascodesmis nigricans]|uniref:Cytochrome P450 n=1 Tax=Ascodesmis nigricans TaxID=341454 RepID=A0A4V3SJ85_9PEZI|nr:cytochrome P450 [Ascodesmis nigricans]